MNHLSLKFTVLIIALVFSNSVFAATDTYRWLHVTIDTPWAIFIFLLPMVLLPVVLMAGLYWRFSGNKTKTPDNIKNK